MSADTSYNKELAKETTQKLILNISKFLCENKMYVDRLKYNLDICGYESDITIDIDDGLYKLGISLADLLRYWDDDNDDDVKE